MKKASVSITASTCAVFLLTIVNFDGASAVQSNSVVYAACPSPSYTQNKKHKHIIEYSKKVTFLFIFGEVFTIKMTRFEEKGRFRKHDVVFCHCKGMHVTEASRIWVRLTVARTQGQVHIRLSSNLEEWSSRVVNYTIQQKPERDDVINC